MVEAKEQVNAHKETEIICRLLASGMPEDEVALIRFYPYAGHAQPNAPDAI